jgi:hypothetical protein
MPLCLLLLLYIINALEVGVLAPALCMFCLLSVVFLYLPSLSARFLRQAPVGHEMSQKNKRKEMCGTRIIGLMDHFWTGKPWVLGGGLSGPRMWKTDGFVVLVRK